MKVLLDMNLSPRWADYLRNEGIDAIHWSRLGTANSPDVNIIEFAKIEDYIVLTQDLDFGKLLATTR